MQPAIADAFRIDLGLVQEATRNGVTPGCARAHDKHWERWDTFCVEHKLDPFLRNHADPLPILQVFGQRYRDGRIAPSGRTVRAQTVEDALRAVGQKCTSVGAKDIRKDCSGSTDFRLRRQIRSYKRLDGPPSRVKPLPITIIMYILHQAHRKYHNLHDRKALADIITIAFYFLLRPGEYTGTTSDDAPFRLNDITLYLGQRPLNTLTAPLHEIQAATAVGYMFTTQKNGIKGEKLLHSRSGNPWCCPVYATTRQVLHLRAHNATAATPIASYYSPKHKKLLPIKAKDVTEVLRTAAAVNQRDTGLHPKEISARSLRAGGAMALLCGKIDDNLIKLLGRWHSDAMIRYLHVQAEPLMRHFAKAMFNNGAYTFHPGELVPISPTEDN